MNQILCPKRTTAADGECVDLNKAICTLATFRRPGWREALGSVADAPRRLHRYRDLRMRLLHAAFAHRDGRDSDES